jgi:hypothetical protein
VALREPGGDRSGAGGGRPAAGQLDGDHSGQGVDARRLGQLGGSRRLLRWGAVKTGLRDDLGERVAAFLCLSG